MEVPTSNESSQRYDQVAPDSHSPRSEDVGCYSRKDEVKFLPNSCQFYAIYFDCMINLFYFLLRFFYEKKYFF